MEDKQKYKNILIKLDDNLDKNNKSIFDFVVISEKKSSDYNKTQLKKVKSSDIKKWLKTATKYYKMQNELKTLFGKEI
jgi:hypothetical protein